MFKSIRLSLALAALLLSPAPGMAQSAAKVPPVEISETLTIPRASVTVRDSHMSYLELGQGAPVLFLHGNPTSAYLWRNVMPHVADTHRAIAVDLIGMGQSGKPDIAYRFADHAAYLDAFIAALDLDDITLVAHDWGAALAWDYARRNPDRVRRIAFMEGVLPPAFPQPSYEAMGAEMGGMFRALRDPAQGHQMIIENNLFVDQILPAFVVRDLGPEARETYGAPYGQPQDRRPTLAWPREIPIAGEPAESAALMQEIAAFMAQTDLPVLLAHARPGVLVPPQAVDWYVGTIRNLETAFIGTGLHYVQEDQPDAIGLALRDWMRRN